MPKVKIISSILLCVSWFYVMGQQDPSYTNYVQAKQIFNPATVGLEASEMSVRGLGYNLWYALDPNHHNPNTFLIPRGILLCASISPFNDSIFSKVAFGFSSMSEQLGYKSISSLKFQGSYTMLFPSTHAELLIGLELGSTEFGSEKRKFGVGGAKDTVHIASDNCTDWGAGVMFQKEKLTGKLSGFYVGLSIGHINQPEFVLDFGIVNLPAIYQMARHLYFVTGLTMRPANEKWAIEPSILARYNKKFELSSNCLARYNQTLIMGLGYRQSGSLDLFSVILGHQRRNFQVGYSYDITPSKFNSTSYGTHEIYLVYNVKK